MTARASLATVPPWNGALDGTAYGSPGDLLATGARRAGTLGRCALCSRAYGYGAYIADLVTGGTAHVPCIAGSKARKIKSPTER